MRTLHQWLDEYGESHQNRTNKALHWVCVPVIVLCVFGLLASIPVPATVSGIAPWFDWGIAIAALATLYYLKLSPLLAVGAGVCFALLFLVLRGLEALPWPLWATCTALFVLAWIGQFVGHAIEGRRPSFFKDLQFLMIGPLWLLAFVYRGLGLRYA